MEAVCPQCQMRYEVGQELLDQGTPVLCPTCQVSLILVEPGTNTPLTTQPPQEAPAEPETQTAGPAGPGDSWNAGDLLWGGTSAGSDGQEPAEEVALSVPEPVTAPATELSGWGALSEPPPPGEGTPVEAEPAPVQPEAEPATEQAPEVASFTTPTWGASTPEEEITAPPAEPPGEPETGSEEELPEITPEPLEDGIPEPMLEAEPAIGAPPLESPAEEAGEAGDAPSAEPEPAPAESPEPAEAESASVPSMTWEAPGTRAPAAPASPAPQPAAGTPPGPFGSMPEGSTVDDWAAAAARWAASGFASDQMPGFVKTKEAGTPSQAASQAPAPAGPSGQEQAAPQPAPDAPDPVRVATPVAEAGAAPAASAPMPPPLPKTSIELPSPQAPPPLGGKRRSTYVMRGSGEGVSDQGAPWAGATPSVPESQPEMPAASQADAALSGGLVMQLPKVSAPQPVPSEPQPVRVEVPKPRRTAVWLIPVVLIVGAGGFAAWYFHKQSQQIDSVDPGTKDPANHAGVGGGTVGLPDEPETAAVADAGAVDAGKTAETVDDPAVEGSPPPDAPDKGDEKRPGAKKKRKRKKDVAVRLKRDKKAAAAHYTKGNTLIRKKKFKEAIVEFKAALKADPSLAQAHRSLGISYAQVRQNKKACREYRIYMRMIPSTSKEIPQLKQIIAGCK